MESDNTFFEPDDQPLAPDPDEIPIRDRRVITQPYDLVVESLIDQIENKTMFLRPLSERPNFQRRYVWNDVLASRLIGAWRPPCPGLTGESTVDKFAESLGQCVAAFPTASLHYGPSSAEVTVVIASILREQVNKQLDGARREGRELRGTQHAMRERHETTRVALFPRKASPIRVACQR